MLHSLATTASRATVLNLRSRDLFGVSAVTLPKPHCLFLSGLLNGGISYVAYSNKASPALAGDVELGLTFCIDTAAASRVPIQIE